VVKLADQWEQYPGISDRYCVEIGTGKIEIISKYLDLDDIFVDQFSCTKDHVEASLRADIECYKAMKEGVQIRIADLDNEIFRLRRELEERNK
jgi:hypothetical protein